MNAKGSITKQTAVKNSVWKLLEAFGTKGISILVSIVLARILLPEVYGVISLTHIFINLTDILIQAGFATTLIRKEKVTDEDYSTVLSINIISAIILYMIIFVASPWIAKFYETPQLLEVLRVIALTLFCQAFASVRTAVISRTMQFRTLFMCTIIANITSGTIGIVTALMGFGVWALVLQQLLQQVILTILLLIKVKMRYKFRISGRSVKEIVPESVKILVSSLLSFSGDSMYSVTIGKVYSMEELGYSEKGSLFPRSFALYTFSAVSNVFLPVFASYQNDCQRLRQIFKRVFDVTCYVIFPIMAGLCMVAEPLISVVLTDKWLPAVGIMRWNCLYYAAVPLILANVQLHFAIGKNGIRIKSEVLRIVIMIVALIVCIVKQVPIETIVAVVAIIQPVIAVYLMFETKKVIGYRLIDAIWGVLPSLVSTVVMCIAVCFVLMLPFSNIVVLVISILVGGGTYMVTSIVLKNPAYYEVRDMLKGLLKKGNH